MKQSKYFAMGGGLDLKTPLLQSDPGRLLIAKNVEQKITGGYRRVDGYIKYDTNIVPGEGSILGVWFYDGKVYAFRNAVGGATAAMHESTGTGWTAKKTGLSPGGRYEFVNYNFGTSKMMYGVSGTHKAFQWDGTTWTDITVGWATDTPQHIIAHKNYLFLSYDQSVVNSDLGVPTAYTGVGGANEIRIEDGVTGFMQMAGGVLGIFGRNSTNLLSGSSATDFNMSNLSEHGNRIGAIEWSLQQLGARVRYFDDRGVTELGASDRFGDFQDAMISVNINDWLLPKKNLVNASCIVRNKSQYRLFFNDSTGMSFTFQGDTLAGITTFEFPLEVKCVVSTEDSNGDEAIYWGSTDGYIYEMDTATSFDGANIVTLMYTQYTFIDSPRKRKRFRRAIFEMPAVGVATGSLFVKPDFEVEQAGIVPQIAYKSIVTRAGGGALGSGALGSLVLGSTLITEGQLDIPGHGAYIAMIFSSDDQNIGWEIDGITYDYLEGRGRR